MLFYSGGNNAYVGAATTP